MAASTIAASRALISSSIAATATSVARQRAVPASSTRKVASIACAQHGEFLGHSAIPGKTQVPNSTSAVTGSSRRTSWAVCQARGGGAAGARVMSTATEAKGAIKVGEKLPEAELSYLDKDSNVQTVKVSELTGGKKVVIFAVPGAFTPTCTQKHVPGFISKADELKKKGVDTIACVSVNDVFVLNAWGQSLGVGEKVLLLSDGNATFTKALGVQMDLSDKPVGLGLRSRRYALLAEDGVVKQLNLEEGGAFSVSGPDEILKAL